MKTKDRQAAMKYKSILFALLLAVSAALLCGCERHSSKERSGFYFDTYITVKIYDTDDETADGVLSLCRKYDEMFSRTDERSDVWRINHSRDEAVNVSDETAELLTLAQGFTDISGGRFDVTCGSLTSLWDFSAEAPQVPKQEDISAALAFVGSEKLSINGNQVQVQEGVQLDLGGIAKGYIADRIADYLKEHGVKNAVINLGGNVVVLGDKFGEKYKVGIQSPFNESYIDSLLVADCSVVTAGTYQRGFTADGVYYHHILDVKTGYPAETGLAAVTVISENSAECDAMATTLFLLGVDEGMKLAEETDGFEAVFISENGTVAKTSGLNTSN